MSRIAVLGSPTASAMIALAEVRQVLPLSSWSEIIPLVSARSAPDILVVLSGIITSESRPILHALHDRGILPYVILLMEDHSHETIRSAWRLRNVAVRLAFSAHEVLDVADERYKQAGQHVVMRYVQQRLDIDGLALRVTEAVADSVQAGCSSVDDVMTRVRRKRSTVYAALSAAGVPGVEQLLMLMRLMRSVDVIHRGGTLPDAAHYAGYAGVKSWRKSLRDRTGLGVAEIRERPNNWKWVVDRWLHHQAAPVSISYSCTDSSPHHRTVSAPSRTLEGRPERQIA